MLKLMPAVWYMLHKEANLDSLNVGSICMRCMCFMEKESVLDSIWGAGDREHAPVAPPQHPSYDLDVSVRAALEEDAGQLGDVTTLAT